MIKIQAEQFKWICIVLSAIIILLAVFLIKDKAIFRLNDRIASERQVAFNLATSLSQVNRLITPGSQIFVQINGVLQANGYADLIVPLPEAVPLISEVDSLGTEEEPGKENE